MSWCTSVQIRRPLKGSMTENRHEPESLFSRREPLLEHHATTSPTGKVRRCKQNAWLKRMKWPCTQQDSDLVSAVSVVKDRKIPGDIMEVDHLIHQFADGERGKLALRMISEFIISKHTVGWNQVCLFSQ